MAKFDADKPDLLYNLLYIEVCTNVHGIEDNMGFRLCKWNNIFPNSYSTLVTEDWQDLLNKPWGNVCPK